MARAGKVNHDKLKVYQEFCKKTLVDSPLPYFDFEEWTKTKVIYKQESIQSRFDILDL